MPKPKIIIISHTDHSRQVQPAGMGEINNSKKFRDILLSQGYDVEEILDTYDLFGGGKAGEYNLWHLAKENFDLAGLGGSRIKLSADDSGDNQKNAENFLSRMRSLKGNVDDTVFIMTWDWNLAGILRTGVLHDFVTISKCYPFHLGHTAMIPRLFEATDLIITECLLGNRACIDSGLLSWMTAYVPHNFPSICDEMMKGTAQ